MKTTTVSATDDHVNQRALLTTHQENDPGHEEVVREVIATVLESRWYHWLILGILAASIWTGLFWHAAHAEKQYLQFQAEIEAREMGNHR